MTLLPMEMVDEILTYNNRKLVLNKKTGEYDLRILSFDSYQNIEDVYASVKFYGSSVYKPISDYFVKWYEISYKDKWQMRNMTKLSGPCLTEDEYSGYVYCKQTIHQS